MTTPKITNSAFAVDTRITIKIEVELAIALGKLVLETTTDNTALLALGHKLRGLAHAKHVELERIDTEQPNAE